MTNAGTWSQGAEDIVVTNGLAYLAEGNSGLGIVNVSSPAVPMLITNLDTPGYASALFVSEGLVYVADGSAGLQIINVTNPAAPFLVSSYDTPGDAKGVVVRSNLAFVADSTGLAIIDVTNPSSPVLRSMYSTNMMITCVCLSGSYAVIGGPSSLVRPPGNDAAIRVIEVSDPTQPLETGRITNGVRALTADNGVVYGIDDNYFAPGNFVIISITNPAQPTVTATVNYSYDAPFYFSSLDACDVQVLNGRAFVATHRHDLIESSYLLVFDLSNLTEPLPVGNFALASPASSTWVEGNLAYLVGTNGPMQIVGMPFNSEPISLPSLTLFQQGNLQLGLKGRRGFNYQIESAPDLSGGSWQPLQSVLLTNRLQLFPVPANSSKGFFRARQLD
jgi:hypothetical protein